MYYYSEKGEKMSANDLLKTIYTKFYEQQEVLADAPKLTQVPEDTQFDTEKADTELAAVISYLMGVSDIREESFEHAMEIIQKHYDNQPEWKELLIEYFEYVIEKQKEKAEKRVDNLIKEIEEFTDKLLAKK